MITLIINNKHVTIKGASAPQLRRLQKATSYLVAGYYWSPAFRAHRWDGREHLIKFSEKYGYRAPTGLLPTIWRSLVKSKVKVKMIDRRRRVATRCAFQWNEKIQMRPYQEAAVEAITNKFPGRGILKMPIRSGKTFTMARIIYKMKVRALFIVTSQMLLHQARAAFEDVLMMEGEVGIIGDQQWQEGDVTVATIQTLSKARENKDPRYKKLLSRYGLAIFDECFPAGTSVGGKRIEEIKVGDMVDSFDEHTKTISKNEVTHVFKSKPLEMVMVSFSNGEKLACTCHHPFLTSTGWKSACELRSCDLVYKEKGSQNAEKENGCGHEVPLVRSGDSNLRRTEGITRQNRPSVLLKRMFQKVRGESQCRDHGQNQSKVCVRADEEKQSHVKAGNESKVEQNSESYRPQAESLGREWQANGSAPESAFGRFVRKAKSMGWGILHRDRPKEERRVAVQFQNRRGESRVEDSSGGGRIQPHGVGRARSRQEERRLLETVRVESVKILEPGSDRRFGGVCPDGYVYNLEVKGTNTYLANGYAVHNCHHLVGDAWREPILELNTLYKIGLSATVYLKNTREMERGVIWLTACCGNVRYQIGTSKLIEDGYLMSPLVKMYEVKKPDLTAQKWSQSLRNEAIYENKRRNRLIVKLARKYGAKGMRVLIVSNRLNQIDKLLMALEDTELSVAAVTGSTPASKRRIVMDEFSNGSIQVLVGTVFGEGVDIPEVACVINAEGGRDIKSTVQRMRNLTPSKGKKKAVFIDFMDYTNKYFEKHSKERLDVYESEPGFKVKIIKSK